MNENAMLTGKPSIDRPWMKFYPDVLRGIQVPACTVEQYLSVRAADPNVIAMHYYGVDITWGTVFRKVDATARALQVLGVKQGDQIPVFLRSVPEFIYLLLAAERIGASLLCRDNTLEENIEAVQKANAKVILFTTSSPRPKSKPTVSRPREYLCYRSRSGKRRPRRYAGLPAAFPGCPVSGCSRPWL